MASVVVVVVVDCFYIGLSPLSSRLIALAYDLITITTIYLIHPCGKLKLSFDRTTNISQ